MLFWLLLTSLPVWSLQADFTEDLRIQWSKVPATETYYVCQQFKVPADRPYHIHSFEPVVNNTAAVHHMLLFGCNFKMDTALPHPCDDLDNRCRTWLIKWDVGMAGRIDMPPDTGVRFGLGSFEHVLLQVHWNNPRQLDSMTDNSGFRIHYTDNLKKYDVGNVQLGQNDVTIPPRSRDVVITGACISSCTAAMLARSVYVSDIYLHMHGLGVRASLDVYRDREVIDRLALEENYNYTGPIVHSLKPARRIDPGDEVRLTCWYDSLTGDRLRNQTIKFGQGSQAEMCYAFVRYYPNQMGFHQCLQTGQQNAEMCYAFVRYYPNQMGFHQCLQTGQQNVNC